MEEREWKVPRRTTLAANDVSITWHRPLMLHPHIVWFLTLFSYIPLLSRDYLEKGPETMGMHIPTLVSKILYHVMIDINISGSHSSFLAFTSFLIHPQPPCSHTRKDAYWTLVLGWCLAEQKNPYRTVSRSGDEMGMILASTHVLHWSHRLGILSMESGFTHESRTPQRQSASSQMSSLLYRHLPDHDLALSWFRFLPTCVPHLGRQLRPTLFLISPSTQDPVLWVGISNPGQRNGCLVHPVLSSSIFHPEITDFSTSSYLTYLAGSYLRRWQHNIAASHQSCICWAFV